MSEQVWWYATRAAGLMTWGTASASVIVGLLLSSRAIRARTGPWFLDLHRFLAATTILFLAAHMGALWADSFVEFGPKELFVPGASAWRPEAIAWGIIAGYVLVAVQVTSLLRAHITARVWRMVHYLSFVTVLAGGYHAYLAGSDVTNPITWAIAGSGSVMVIILIAARLKRHSAEEDPTGANRLDDREAVLLEMRERLAELPVPEATPQPQLAESGTTSLPRRSPVAAPEAPAPVENLPPIAGLETGFTADPFAAVPLDADPPEFGGWVGPSPADPFGEQPLDPFRRTTSTPLDPNPAPAEPEARPLTNNQIAWEGDDGQDLFDQPSDSPSPSIEEPAPAAPAAPLPEPRPVERPDPFLVTPAFDAPLPDMPSPDASRPDVFAHEQTEEPASNFVGNPFKPVAPPPRSYTEPTEVPEPAREPVSVASVSAGPPPLPTAAVDPITGEPDHDAYALWLKDWLVFAERYGNETPEDPTRI